LTVKASAELEQLSAVHSVPLPVVVFAAYLVSSSMRSANLFHGHDLRIADMHTASDQLSCEILT
jgi:hypothetical protein